MESGPRDELLGVGVGKPDVEDGEEGDPDDRLHGAEVAICCPVFFPRMVFLVTWYFCFSLYSY